MKNAANGSGTIAGMSSGTGTAWRHVPGRCRNARTDRRNGGHARRPAAAPAPDDWLAVEEADLIAAHDDAIALLRRGRDPVARPH